MSFPVDVFWSFRSPYSYLAASRLVELWREWDVHFVLRPVYPIALRIPGFFRQVNPLWPPYLLRDCARLAEMRGQRFAWPSPDPIVQDLATMEVATDQPYIHRLTRLGVAAQRRGKGLAFADEVSRLIFGGTRGWHEGDHLAGAATRAGLDRRARCGDQRGRRPSRSRNRAQRGRPAGRRPLGSAVDGVSRRTVLRPGPCRRAAVAHAAGRTRPERFGAGTHILLFVAGARGDAELWTFNVQGIEMLGDIPH